MLDVMFFEAFDEEEKEIRRRLPGHVRAGFTPKTIAESGTRQCPSGLISIRTQSKVPREWTKDIKGVLTRSQGYDHLLAFRRECGSDIACGYLGRYCARAVAEQAVMTMMALLRKLKKQVRQFETFARDGLTGGECRGRKALVIGVGNIGREIVDMAKGMRMVVKGVDIAPSLKDIEYVGLSDGIAWADVVFCALPLTERTDRMLDYAALRTAGPGLIFVNVGRGEISPVDGLKRLLAEKILAGIGLDVYPDEGALADALRSGGSDKKREHKTVLELARNEAVIFTPHNAFNTEEALERKALLTVEAVVSFLNDGRFPFPLPAA